MKGGREGGMEQVGLVGAACLRMTIVGHDVVIGLDGWRGACGTKVTKHYNTGTFRDPVPERGV